MFLFDYWLVLAVAGLLVIGMLAAFIECRISGKGQVIDAAITDGSASLMSVCHSLAGLGTWCTSRQSNLLDGGAPFYRVYETSDGKFVSIGSIEPQFYALLLEKVGIDPNDLANRQDDSKWPALSEELAKIFRTRTQAEWCSLLEGTDACFAPVLDYDTAPSHPHNAARGTYVNINGLIQPAPAPRFSRSECDTPAGPKPEGSDTDAVLRDCGFSDAEIHTLRSANVLS